MCYAVCDMKCVRVLIPDSRFQVCTMYAIFISHCSDFFAEFIITLLDDKQGRYYMRFRYGTFSRMRKKVQNVKKTNICEFFSSLLPKKIQIWNQDHVTFPSKFKFYFCCFCALSAASFFAGLILNSDVNDTIRNDAMSCERFKFIYVSFC